jgi:pilus assembly protein Flp/PilA
MYALLLGWLRSLTTTEEGVTAIEYGLIAALMTIVIISGISLLGSEVETTFNIWTSAVHNAVSNAGS